jgi:adenylate cyclase, class 2
VPIEVERKARVSDPERIKALLARRASAEASTYHDTYYDWPDSRLERDGGQELRVRLVENDGGQLRVLLTFKAAMLDRSSTPEFETTVGDLSAADAILTGLGLVHLVAFHKRCVNYTFRANGHDIKATVVQVPELEGETFLEVETIIDDRGQTVAASNAVHSVLGDLGLSDEDLTDELYVDRVRARRGGTP